MNSSIDKIAQLIAQIAANENVKNPKFERENLGIKGDGYIGETQVYNVHGIDANKKTLSVFIKRAPSNPGMRELFPVRLMYLREIYFYEHLLPALNSFQAEKLAHPENFVAQYYGGIHDEMDETVALANLKLRGFEMWPRNEFMNVQHCKCVLETYGRLHAVSFALRDQKPEVFARLTAEMPSLFAEVAHFLHGEDVVARRLATLFDPIKDRDLLMKYERFCADIADNYKQLPNVGLRYSVISHGDCWCNNIMFKYDDHRQKPIDIALVDFQLTGNTTPVLDLSYFLYVSGCAEVHNNLDEYLQRYYYRSLSEYMSLLGSDAKSVFPYDELKRLWHKQAKMGLGLALFIQKFVCLPEQETVDWAAEYAAGKAYVDVALRTVDTDVGYRERMKHLIQHFYENDLF